MLELNVNTYEKESRYEVLFFLQQTHTYRILEEDNLSEAKYESKQEWLHAMS